jgi:hypothetical protein
MYSCARAASGELHVVLLRAHEFEDKDPNFATEPATSKSLRLTVRRLCFSSSVSA